MERLALWAHLPALEARRELEANRLAGIIVTPERYRDLQYLATGDATLADEEAAVYAEWWQAQRRGDEA